MLVGCCLPARHALVREGAQEYTKRAVVTSRSLFQHGMSLEAGPYFQRGMSLGVRFGSIICCMVIDMNEQKLNTVAQLRAFLEGTKAVRFDVHGEDNKRRYVFIAEACQTAALPASQTA